MDGTNAYEGVYHNEKAVYLRAGSYEAIMLPDIGGNLISFRDLDKGAGFCMNRHLTKCRRSKQGR